MKDTCQSKASKIGIVILGTSGVGKTAITVRYLTHKFIGEYQSGVDLTYQHTIPQFSNWASSIEFFDTSGSKESNVSWITEMVQRYKIVAFLVVYSLTDASSFHEAQELLSNVPERSSRVLVANKFDLEHRRQVSFEDGHSVAARYKSDFFEVSAAENSPSLKGAFQTVIQQCISQVPLTCPKICISAVSKLLGSLVTRSSRSTSSQRTKKMSTSSSSSSVSTPHSVSPSSSVIMEKSRAIPINRRTFFRPKSHIVSI